MYAYTRNAFVYTELGNTLSSARDKSWKDGSWTESNQSKNNFLLLHIYFTHMRTPPHNTYCRQVHV